MLPKVRYDHFRDIQDSPEVIELFEAAVDFCRRQGTIRRYDGKVVNTSINNATHMSRCQIVGEDGEVVSTGYSFCRGDHFQRSEGRKYSFQRAIIHLVRSMDDGRTNSLAAALLSVFDINCSLVAYGDEAPRSGEGASADAIGKRLVLPVIGQKSL